MGNPRWFTYYFAVDKGDFNQLMGAGLKGDMLISFAMFNASDTLLMDRLASLRKAGYKVMLDSGAFTNLNKPGTVKFEQYVEFLQSHKNDFDEYITFDDLKSRTKTISAYDALVSKGFDPLFVDHLWMKDHPRLKRIWKDKDKLCLSAWAKTNPNQENTGSTAGSKSTVFPDKMTLARDVSTKTHLLACGSMTRVLRFADKIDSVDSTAWDKAVAFGKVLYFDTKEVEGMHVPILRGGVLPGGLSRKDGKALPREVLGRLADFKRSIGWNRPSNTRIFRLFNFLEIKRYVTALNKMSAHGLVHAFEESFKRKQKGPTTKTILLPWHDDAALHDDDPSLLEEAESIAKSAERQTADQALAAAADLLGVEHEVEEPVFSVADIVATVQPEFDETEFDETEEHTIKLLPVEVEKADEERIVFGVVLEPGTIDAQNDTISSDEIKDAAHQWLARFQNRGLMHAKLVNDKVQIFESYIAPVDLTLGGEKVKKGTWLLMYKILDAALWAKIKSGELTGFSMGGFARRVRTSK